MNLSIFILEDDSIQSKTLTEYIHDYSTKIEVCVASTKEEAITLLKSHSAFTAYLLDVSLNDTTPNADGLLVANYIIDSRLASTSKQRNIIFITALPEHIYTAVNDIHCVAYLLKPYSKQDLFRQLDMLFHIEQTLLLKTVDGIIVKINYPDIYYIESHTRYMYFHTTQGVIKSRQYRLKELAALLPDFFIQCHKSYIINSNDLESVIPKSHFLQLKNVPEKIPYSESYYSMKKL